jgi:hypothetical protein
MREKNVNPLETLDTVTSLAFVVATDVSFERRRSVNAHGGTDATLATALGQVVLKVSPLRLFAHYPVDDESATCANQVGRAQVFDKRLGIFVQTMGTHCVGNRQRRRRWRSDGRSCRCRTRHSMTQLVFDVHERLNFLTVSRDRLTITYNSHGIYLFLSCLDSLSAYLLFA